MRKTESETLAIQKFVCMKFICICIHKIYPYILCVYICIYTHICIYVLYIHTEIVNKGRKVIKIGNN